MVGRMTWVKIQQGKKRLLVPLSHKKAAGRGWDREDESHVNGSGRTPQGEVRENRQTLIATRQENRRSEQVPLGTGAPTQWHLCLSLGLIKWATTRGVNENFFANLMFSGNIFSPESKRG